MSFGRKGRLLRAVLVASLAAMLVLATAGVASAQAGIPEGVTEQSENVNFLWIIVTTMAVLVWLLVTVALIYILLRYRRRSESDPLPAQVHGNTAIEVLWVAIPVVIVIALFTISLVALFDIEDEADAEALTVEVDGFRWQWGFTYDMEDLGETALAPASGEVSILGTTEAEPVLYLPAHEEVEFVLHSADVIHSFYIRDFLYKLDVVPGRENRFRVVTKDPGEFHGQCAEFCGTDHAIMRFSVRVVPREDFDAWVADQAVAQGIVPDAESLLVSAGN